MLYEIVHYMFWGDTSIDYAVIAQDRTDIREMKMVLKGTYYDTLVQ